MELPVPLKTFRDFTPEKYKESIKAYISMINSTMSRQDFEQGKKIYEKGYENFLKIVEKK